MQVFLHITTPPSNTRREDSMEDLLLALHRILPNHAEISLEMVSTDQFLKFYIVTQAEVIRLVESQVYAHYPDAEIEQVDDYLYEFGRNVFYTQIDFKRSSIFPLLTYKNI